MKLLFKELHLNLSKLQAFNKLPPKEGKQLKQEGHRKAELLKNRMFLQAVKFPRCLEVKNWRKLKVKLRLDVNSPLLTLASLPVIRLNQPRNSSNQNKVKLLVRRMSLHQVRFFQCWLEKRWTRPRVKLLLVNNCPRLKSVKQPAIR